MTISPTLNLLSVIVLMLLQQTQTSAASDCLIAPDHPGDALRAVRLTGVVQVASLRQLGRDLTQGFARGLELPGGGDNLGREPWQDSKQSDLTKTISGGMATIDSPSNVWRSRHSLQFGAH